MAFVPGFAALTGFMPPAASRTVTICRAVFLFLAAHANGQNPQPAPTTTTTQINQAALTLDEALRLANAEASAYQSAILNEQVQPRM
jgi:hypothetical protein